MMRTVGKFGYLKHAIMNIISEYLPQIQQLMRKHHVQAAYAFGSAVRGDMYTDSDVDFVIRFPETMDVETYADHYFGLAYALEELLKKPVDLVAEETLSNPYFIQSIDNHKMKVI